MLCAQIVLNIISYHLTGNWAKLINSLQGPKRIYIFDYHLTAVTLRQKHGGPWWIMQIMQMHIYINLERQKKPKNCWADAAGLNIASVAHWLHGIIIKCHSPILPLMGTSLKCSQSCVLYWFNFRKCTVQPKPFASLDFWSVHFSSFSVHFMFHALLTEWVAVQHSPKRREGTGID